MNSILPKVVALGSAAFGYSLLRGRERYWRGVMERNEAHMVFTDRQQHLINQMKSAGTPNRQIMLWALNLTDPTQFHWFKRPKVYFDGYVKLIQENLFPAFLMLAGVTYAFNGSLLSMGRNALKAVSKVGEYTAKGLWNFTKALWAIRPKGISPVFKQLVPNTPKGIISVAAGIGMGLYTLHLLSQELRGVTQDQIMNYVKRP